MSSATISDGLQYPCNPAKAHELQGSVAGARCVDRGFIAHLQLTAAEAVAASATAVHASFATSDTLATTVTTAITAPPYPRNITATAGGTAGDVKATQVVITGTNENDDVITESLPAFTVNTLGIVAGAKAFKTVTSIVVPAQDGTGVTITIGFGDICGIPHYLLHNTVLQAFVNNVEEVTAPVIVTDSNELEKNTFDLDTALAGTVVDLYYIV